MEFEITAIDDSNIKYFYPFMDRKPLPNEGAFDSS